MRPALVATVLLVFLAPLAAAQGPAGFTRSEVIDDIRNSDIGAGYAQMLNFFVDPSISASRLEDDDGTRYDVFKLPLQYEFPLNDRGLQLAMRGTLSHATAENTSSLLENDEVDSTWTADSAQIGLGLIVPASEQFSWFIAGQLGVSQLENEADYGSRRSRDILAPILDGVLFNWETDASIAGLTGGLDFNTQFASSYDLKMSARYTYNQIKSFSESNDLESFKEETGTFSVSADIDHPWNATIAELPLFGTVHMGGTAFTGPNRKALGFSHFYLLGYSVGLKVGDTNRFFDAFSLGAQVNFGRNVDGYSLRFAWRLK